MEKQDYKINNLTKEIEQNLRKESFESKYFYNDTYLKEYNHICPLCQKKIRKNLRNVLTGAYLIGLIKLEEHQTSISYTLCKKCSKEIMNASVGEKKKYENMISSHVVATIKI